MDDREALDRIAADLRAMDRTDATAELLAALKGMLRLYPAFRSRPIGAPGSAKRAEQDERIAAEDRARAAIARAEADHA